MSLFKSSLPLSNFVCNSWLPIALAALESCLISSSNLLRVLIVVPSKVPVSFCTSTNLAPLHHANTASILFKVQVMSNGIIICKLKDNKNRERYCSESMVAKIFFNEYQVIPLYLQASSNTFASRLKPDGRNDKKYIIIAVQQTKTKTNTYNPGLIFPTNSSSSSSILQAMIAFATVLAHSCNL